MLGSGKGKKKDKDQLPPQQKERKRVSPAETRADNKAMGEQGMAAAASIRATYGMKTVSGRRSKAEIAAEFRARNALEKNDKQAQYNQEIYARYRDDHAERWRVRNSVFWHSKAVAQGQWCYSLSKNQLEKANREPKGEVPDHSNKGDSTNYDMDGDESMKKLLETLPFVIPLPLASSLFQPPAIGSIAGLQEPPPPITKAEQVSLSRKGIHHMPPAAEAGQAECSQKVLLPSVKAVLDEAKKREADKKKAEAKKAEVKQKQKRKGVEAACLLTVLPGLASATSGAEAP